MLFFLSFLSIFIFPKVLFAVSIEPFVFHTIMTSSSVFPSYSFAFPPKVRWEVQGPANFQGTPTISIQWGRTLQSSSLRRNPSFWWHYQENLRHDCSLVLWPLYASWMISGIIEFLQEYPNTLPTLSEG